ncbi:MAG TPA: tetratricopeptide repeat protein, partial [Isosphaeraceae bacterium]
RGWEVREPYPVELISSGARAVAVVVAGTRLVAVDVATGRPAWPARDLGFWPLRAPLLADLDGDGQEEAVLNRDISGEAVEYRRVAVSLKTQLPLWNASAGSRIVEQLADDVEGDGSREIIAHLWSPNDNKMTVIDGATGRQRWQHRWIWEAYRGVSRFLLGPDLDGDGHREVFAVTHGNAEATDRAWHLFVHALSGKDGHPVWRWDQPLKDGLDHEDVAPLRWWSTGDDDRPYLLVSVRGSGGTVPGNERYRRTYVLSAKAGRLVSTLRNVWDPQVADLDDDGTEDLCALGGEQPGALKLQTVRGGPLNVWRRLGAWEPARDYDGDGVADLIRQAGGQHQLPVPLTAVSGRDGRILWQAHRQGQAFMTPPLPHGDLDGDGTPEVLALGFDLPRLEPPGSLHVVSGRTGRPLWTAIGTSENPMPVPDPGHREAIGPECCPDLDGDARPDVFIAFVGKGGNGSAAERERAQLYLAIHSGRHGSVRWSRRLDVHKDTPWDEPLDHRFADLDSDGASDLVYSIRTSGHGTDLDIAEHELRAIRGRDGETFWQKRWTGPARHDPGPWNVPWTVGDVDGDGRPEVIVTDARTGVVTALEGASGRPKWPGVRLVDAGADPEGGDRSAREVRVRHLGLADLGGDGRLAVCLHLTGDMPDPPGPRVVFLDRQGQGRLPEQYQPQEKVRILDAHDLDGDGKEELLWVSTDGALRASRNGFRDILWDLPDIEILDIRPVRGGEPTTLVLGPVDAPRGRDARTGRHLWHFKLPFEVPSSARPPWLWADGPRSLSLYAVVEQPGPVTICRQAVASRPPADATGLHLREPRQTSRDWRWPEAGGNGDDRRADRARASSARSNTGFAWAEYNGRWDKAAVEFAGAIELDPEDAWNWFALALVRLQLGDAPGYRAACARMLARFGDTRDPGTADTVAQACILTSDAVTDRGRPVPLAERAVAGDPRNPDYRNTLGAALHRAGRWKEAVDRLEEARALTGDRQGTVWDWLFLAMAHHRLGHSEEARAWLRRGTRWAEREATPAPAEAAPGPRLSWHQRLGLQLLRREAEELIGQQSPPADRPDDKAAENGGTRDRRDRPEP